MPLLDFELASKRMQYEGGSAGLKPSLINPGAGAHAFSSPPQLDINAGRIAFTPVQPPPVGYPTPTEVSAKAANELLKVWTTAAFEFQEREDTVTAQAVHSQIQMGYDMLLRGDGDKPGYNSSTVVGTSPEDYARIRQDYDSLMASADKLTQLTLAGVTPNARVKAANAIMDSRRMLQNNALAHRDKLVATFREKQYDIASTAFIPSAVEAARTIMSEGLLYDFSEGHASRRLAAVDTFNQEVIQPAVASLGAVYAHGPMDATPESIINSRIIQHLAMSPHEQDQEIALLLYAVNADKIVDIKERKYALDAIQGIQERAAAAMRFEVQMEEAAERQAYKDVRHRIEGEYLDAVLRGDLQQVSKLQRELWGYGTDTQAAMTNIRKAWDNVRPLDPATAEFTAQAVALGMSPVDYVTKADELGHRPTATTLNQVAVSYQNNISGLLDEQTEKATALVRDYITRYNRHIGATAFSYIGAEDKTIATEAVVQRWSAAVQAASQRYLDTNAGQAFDKEDYKRYMTDWINSNITEEKLIEAYDAALNPTIDVPQAYELRNQPVVRNNGFNEARDPFNAMAALKPLIDEGRLKDPHLKRMALSYIEAAKDPNIVLQFYKGFQPGASAEELSNSQTLLKHFTTVYLALQEDLWQSTTGVSPETIAGWRTSYGAAIGAHFRNVYSHGFETEQQVNEE